MLHKKTPEKRPKYECKKCSFICSKKSDYIRHCNTEKHNATKCYINATSKNANFICGCGRQYKHSSSFYRHKNNCFVTESHHDIIVDPEDCDTDSIIDLLKQNQEFKQILIEQNKMMVEQQSENKNLQRQLLEAVKDGKTITNNNTTNNNNQKFSLNFFLNTTCKDAMNMSEFIENINIDFKDIENIGKNGYVAGMTNMILSRIKDLDVTKRPLHCTDLKRETMYIKDNDEWCKDTPDNSKLRDMITIVGKQNCEAIPLWRQEHPECLNGNHPKYEFCVEMMRNILGEVGNEQIKLDNKIIKNLSRHLLVDKN